MKVENKRNGKDRDVSCSCSASGHWGRAVHTNDNEDSLGQKNGKRRNLMGCETNDTNALYRHDLFNAAAGRQCTYARRGNGSLFSRGPAPGTGWTQSDACIHISPFAWTAHCSPMNNFLELKHL